LKLDVTAQEIAAIILEAKLPEPPEAASGRAMVTSRVDANLAEAFLRLLRLVDSPEDLLRWSRSFAARSSTGCSRATKGRTCADRHVGGAFDAHRQGDRVAAAELHEGAAHRGARRAGQHEHLVFTSTSAR